MSSIAEAVPRPRLTIDPRAMRFVGVLLAASIATTAVFPLILPWGIYPQDAGLIRVLTMVSTAHIGMTGSLWVDRRYRAHIAAEPAFSYGVPALAAAIAVGSVLAFGLIGTTLFTSAFQAWLMYHFGRQNWGVLCLSAESTRAPRPLHVERWLNLAASAGGAIGLVAPLLSQDSIVAPIYGDVLRGLWHLGFVITMAVAVCSIVLVFARLREGAHPLHVGTMAIVGLFFVPLYVFGSTLGVAIIGQIHAFQYMAIMSLVASDRRQGNPALRLTALAGMAVGLTLLNAALYHGAFWGSYAPEASILVPAITIWHFIIDADVWRLRQPFQRKTLRESLPYLFARA